MKASASKAPAITNATARLFPSSKVSTPLLTCAIRGSFRKRLGIAAIALRYSQSSRRDLERRSGLRILSSIRFYARLPFSLRSSRPLGQPLKGGKQFCAIQKLQF